MGVSICLRELVSEAVSVCRENPCVLVNLIANNRKRNYAPLFSALDDKNIRYIVTGESFIGIIRDLYEIRLDDIRLIYEDI